MARWCPRRDARKPRETTRPLKARRGSAVPKPPFALYSPSELAPLRNRDVAHLFRPFHPRLVSPRSVCNPRTHQTRAERCSTLSEQRKKRSELQASRVPSASELEAGRVRGGALSRGGGRRVGRRPSGEAGTASRASAIKLLTVWRCRCEKKEWAVLRNRRRGGGAGPPPRAALPPPRPRARALARATRRGSIEFSSVVRCQRPDTLAKTLGFVAMLCGKSHRRGKSACTCLALSARDTRVAAGKPRGDVRERFFGVGASWHSCVANLRVNSALHSLAARWLRYWHVLSELPPCGVPLAGPFLRRLCLSQS